MRARGPRGEPGKGVPGVPGGPWLSPGAPGSSLAAENMTYGMFSRGVPGKCQELQNIQRALKSSQEF